MPPISPPDSSVSYVENLYLYTGHRYTHEKVPSCGYGFLHNIYTLIPDSFFLSPYAAHALLDNLCNFCIPLIPAPDIPESSVRNLISVEHTRSLQNATFLYPMYLSTIELGSVPRANSRHGAGSGTHPTLRDR